jgi:hypothetical protein
MDPTGKSSAKVQKSSAVPRELGGRMKKGPFKPLKKLFSL